MRPTIIIGLLACCGGLAAADLQLELGSTGLERIAYGGAELLADAQPQIVSVHAENVETRDDGTLKRTYEELPLGETQPAFDSQAQAYVASYPWGAISLGYRQEEDHLVIDLGIENRSERTIAGFKLRPVTIALPAVPREWENRPRHRIITSHDEFPMVGLHYQDTQVLACIETQDPPVSFGFRKPNGKETPTTTLEIGSSGQGVAPDLTLLPMGQARIPAGETGRWRFSLRFAPGDAAWSEQVPDVIEAFRERYPYVNQWEDRRPIGALFLKTHKAGSENPRGWFDLKLDVSTPEGKQAMRDKLMDYTQRSIATMQQFDMQGGIVWNIEGAENPHPITYIGDPRMTKLLAPEMDEIADEMFAAFRDAGLRTGVCIRPTQLYFDDKKQQWRHGTGSHVPEVRDPLADDYEAVRPKEVNHWEFYPFVERLSRKITYAQERWGCTLFYIDTNNYWAPTGPDRKFESHLLNGEVWIELKKRHPDVLLIPELIRESYGTHHSTWAACAAYQELDMGGRGTPGFVREIYPEAFSLLNISDGKRDELSQAIIDAAASGDILLARGWFPCTSAKDAQKYQQAAQAQQAGEGAAE